MSKFAKMLLKWAAIIWACLFMCYYGICIIMYYSNHTQEEHDYLCDSSNPGFYTEMPTRQLKILTFQKIEIDTMCESHEIQFYYDAEDAMRDIITDIKDGKECQPWTYLKLPRIKKIWRDYATLSFVRDEKGMDDIADKVYDNIVKVYANTVMCGHDTFLPEDMLEDYELDRDRWYDLIGDSDYFDHVEESGWRQLRISDYAMQPLLTKAIELKQARTAEQKLQIVDRVFNIIHQRSDIASWFLKGGTNAFMELSEMVV